MTVQSKTRVLSTHQLNEAISAFSVDKNLINISIFREHVFKFLLCHIKWEVSDKQSRTLSERLFSGLTKVINIQSHLCCRGLVLFLGSFCIFRLWGLLRRRFRVVFVCRCLLRGGGFCPVVFRLRRIAALRACLLHVRVIHVGITWFTEQYVN